MDPIRSSHDWKLSFLSEFADFLSRCEAMEAAGLTKETFLALRHTCRALADCATYLMDVCHFKYVLLGSLQSDDLESRFGWLRQLSGANYYISMRQVMESDRKIRAVSLLKFSKFSLADIDQAGETDTELASGSDLYAVADDIISSLLGSTATWIRMNAPQYSMWPVP